MVVAHLSVVPWEAASCDEIPGPTSDSILQGTRQPFKSIQTGKELFFVDSFI